MISMPLTADKKQAWDAVHAAYKGTPLVSATSKGKTIGDLRAEVRARKEKVRPIGFMGGAQKEEIPEREEEAPKEVKAKEEPPKDDMESKVAAFKAKYGPTLPTTKNKAIVIKKDELEAALRVAGFSPEKAKSGAASYEYMGTYGFIIHKTPKGVKLSEEKSDFAKEMEGHERKLDEDIRAALGGDKAKEEAPKEVKAKRLTTLQSTLQKKAEIKKQVEEAAKEAQRVYDANKDKRSYYTGQLSPEAKQKIGRAEENIRSASSSKGGGTYVMLTQKEYEAIVKKHYTRG